MIFRLPVLFPLLAEVVPGSPGPVRVGEENLRDDGVEEGGGVDAEEGKFIIIILFKPLPTSRPTLSLEKNININFDTNFFLLFL